MSQRKHFWSVVQQILSLNQEHEEKYFCNFERFLKNEWIISNDKKSKIISIIFCLYGWLICVRFIGAAFVSDPKIWNLIGDPFYITGDRILFNIILFGCSLYGSLYRTAFIFGQRSESFSIVYQMMTLGPDSDHCLTPSNVKKLKIASKICSIFILQGIRHSYSGIFCAVYVYYSLLAYFSSDQYFSIVWLLIWFVILQMWAHLITSPIALTFATLYFTVYYLKQRFKQLNERFIRMGRWGKFYFLVKLFQDHNRLSIMTYKYNEFFKYLIFINHFCVTLIATLMYYIFFFGSGGLFLRACNLAVGVGDTAMIFLVTRFSASLAKESVALYPFINSFVCRQRLNHKRKWKIQSFVEWITGPTIGIYCLDFFPLTSYGFFEYFLNCLTNFMLIRKLFNYINDLLGDHI